MLLVLLLISQVTADWVEISQNHYRKEPPRRTTLQPLHYDEKSKDNRIYRNSSAIEKQWNKATIDRVSNVDNIRRVQELSVKTPTVKLRPDAKDSKISDNTDINHRRHDSEHLSIRKPFHEEKISQRKEDRKEVTHTQVMTKFANVEPVKALQIKPSSHIPSNGKKVDNDRTLQNQNSNENKIYKEQGNKVYGIVSDETIHKESDLNDEEYNIRNFQRLPTTVQKPSTNNLKHKFFTTTPVPKTRIDVIFNKDNIEHYQKIGKLEEEDFTGATVENDFKFTNTSIADKPKLHLSELDKIHFGNTGDKISKLDLPSLSNLKTFPGIDLNMKVPEKSVINENTENIETIKDKKEDVIDRFEEVSNATKKETMTAILKLVKIVTDTIYKNTHRSFKSKIKYLEGLKATILSTIEEHFEQAWPDDMEHRSSRHARYAEERGHVEFPSSESTLMTISFLTFAVFLIKLVLQVIHTYKTKTMMVTPAVVAAVGRAASALRSQD